MQARVLARLGIRDLRLGQRRAYLRANVWLRARGKTDQNESPQVAEGDERARDQAPESVLGGGGGHGGGMHWQTTGECT